VEKKAAENESLSGLNVLSTVSNMSKGEAALSWRGVLVLKQKSNKMPIVQRSVKYIAL
jgi:hypothetical protein